VYELVAADPLKVAAPKLVDTFVYDTSRQDTILPSLAGQKGQAADLRVVLGRDAEAARERQGAVCTECRRGSEGRAR
jgi:hypothetical protein